MKIALCCLAALLLTTVVGAVDYPYYSASGIRFKCQEPLKQVAAVNGWPTFYWRRNVGARLDEVKVSVVELKQRPNGDGAYAAAADAVVAGKKSTGPVITKTYPGGAVKIHSFTVKLPALRILVVETSTSSGLVRYFVATMNPGIEAGRAEKMLTTMRVTTTQ